MPESELNFTRYFAGLPDPRVNRTKKHRLDDILGITLCAVICGADSFEEIERFGDARHDWLRTFLALPNGIPSHDTFNRVLAALDPGAFAGCFGRWMAGVCDATGLRPIAVDGKACRSAPGDTFSGCLHLVSAWAAENGVILGQVAVADKTNEIPTAPDLLAQLALTGRVVTVDALLTQTALAETILAQGGDYLMVVKDNQPTLATDLATLFADPDAVVAQTEEATLHGGRCERRRLLASTELVGYVRWPGTQQVLAMERTVVQKGTGEIRTEWAYAVTSLPPARATPAQLLTLWREHWAIENKLHYVRDVTFDEDRAGVWKDRIPQVMAALRNAAIGLARLSRQTNIAAACRYFAARPDAALAALGLPPRL